MKKLILIALTVLTFATVGSQTDFQGQLRAGISAGLPLGDTADLSTFAIAADLGYLFEVSNNFDAGISTGYIHSFADEDSILGPSLNDVQFLPVVASGRFKVAPNLTVGADVGYAISVAKGEDGGFYYSPRVQYSVSPTIDIFGAYRGVSYGDGLGSWQVASFGVEAAIANW